MKYDRQNVVHLHDEHEEVLCSVAVKWKLGEAEATLALGGGSERELTKLKRRVGALRRHLSRIASEDRRSVVDGVPNASCTACLTRLQRYPQIRNRATVVELERDAALDIARVG